MTEAQFQHMRRAHRWLEQQHPGYVVTGWNPHVTMECRTSGKAFRPSETEIADAMSKTATLVEDRVHAIMTPFAQRWRWFCEGSWIVLEPPQGLITAETMLYVHKHPDVHSVEAVFRATPHPGVYLRFCLREITP